MELLASRTVFQSEAETDYMQKCNGLDTRIGPGSSAGGNQRHVVDFLTWRSGL